MPKELERKLKAEARKRKMSQKQTDHYVYGTIARIEKRMRQTRAKKRKR